MFEERFWEVTGVLIMTAKILLILFVSLTGVCPRSSKVIYVKAGEMVALYCTLNKGHNPGAEVIWTSYTIQGRNLTSSMSSAEQRQMGVLVHGRSLVILSATVNHRGNYSCSLGNASSQFWFSLAVCTSQSREYELRTQYSTTCYTQEACTLYCPDVNVPALNIPNITSNGIIWHKEGESTPEGRYFSSVEEHNQGIYTCTRSYLYYDQIYNMTFTLRLDVQPRGEKNTFISICLSLYLEEKKDFICFLLLCTGTLKYSSISSPHNSDVISVDLGSPVVIDCKAFLYSDFDEVFWLRGKSFVETNTSFPVFYNSTRIEINAEEITMTASLVFKKVSEEDLTKNYTCRLDTVTGPSSFVTITLAQKPRPSYVALALGIVGIVMVVLTVFYVRLKNISMHQK
ncbi:X-linked interleukin-1 receptor accessory protein-like 2 isoform X1 [Cottoperca gobio]|uniref:X-linked interleukin-1 receptor accessory protein-like 2 isoform X1 n=1 Tax=Cottoperca gobio TaxID=56716 RepID=A0A6J2RN92_COTGO|nr:X-linked interleukin-1 receptor accessory protein-like 2 isoform X1 [Cottoperca gobio]